MPKPRLIPRVRAIVYERHGGPEVLEPKDVPDPTPGEGERTGAGASVSPSAIIGVEGAGTIADTGERVAWSNVAGSYAQRLAAPPDRLVPVPDGVPSDVAAAAILQG